MAWNNVSEKIALLIDGANTFKASKNVGYLIDYAKVLRVFKPCQAYYFTALPENDRVNNPQSIFKMIDYITYNGYNLISKDMKTYINDGKLSTKGNMDVEIALYLMKVSRWADHIVLFSGDGDFRMAVEEAQSLGVKVTVVSTLKSNPSMIADELRRQANTFIDISEAEWRNKFWWDR